MAEARSCSVLVARRRTVKVPAALKVALTEAPVAGWAPPSKFQLKPSPVPLPLKLAVARAGGGAERAQRRTPGRAERRVKRGIIGHLTPRRRWRGRASYRRRAPRRQYSDWRCGRIASRWLGIAIRRWIIEHERNLLPNRTTRARAQRGRGAAPRRRGGRRLRPRVALPRA